MGNAAPHPKYDYPIQTCLSNHDLHTPPFLDANGAHAGSHCRSTYQASHRKHNNIVKALAKAAREAGLEVRCEPDTYTLLLGDFTKAECRRIFPKEASQAYKLKFAELLATIEQVEADHTMPVEVKQKLLREKINQLPVLASDPAGLRVDLSIEDPLTGEMKLIDVTVAHTTAASYLQKELAAVKQRKTSTTFATNLKLPDALVNEPSPTLATKEKQSVKNIHASC